MVTYIGSRASSIAANELFSTEHLLQQATNSFTASEKFIAELVNLECWDEESCASDAVATEEGAVSNAVGFIVAATVALLAF
jgi:hypothetical protein